MKQPKPNFIQEFEKQKTRLRPYAIIALITTLAIVIGIPILFLLNFRRSLLLIYLILCVIILVGCIPAIIKFSQCPDCRKYMGQRYYKIFSYSLLLATITVIFFTFPKIASTQTDEDVAKFEEQECISRYLLRDKDPLFDKYYKICVKKLGGMPVPADTVRCINTYPEYIEYHEKLKADARIKCKQETDKKAPAEVGSGSNTADFLNCLGAAIDKYPNKQEGHGIWGGCPYSPGQAIDSDACPVDPRLQAEFDECERKYGVNAPADTPGSSPEEKTPLENAKTLDGDPLRDFIQELTLNQLEELFTEKNRANIGVEQWVKLVKASEDIRELRRNAQALGQRSIDELNLYLDSNDLAPWERAVVNEAIERAKNRAPVLPREDFFAEPPGVNDYRSRSRANYAEEIIKRNEEMERRSGEAEQEYKKIIDALNKELGVSPLRQGLADEERKQKEAAIEYDKPDPTYTGFDFSVPYDSASDDDTVAPFVSGRGQSPEPGGYRPPPQAARISGFEGRVVIERTERDGTVTRVQVHRVGTSMRPAVIFEGDRVLVGQDSSVNIIKSNGSENKYTAPQMPKHPTGDEVNTDVQNTVIQPPDPKIPSSNPVLNGVKKFFQQLLPAGDTTPNTDGAVGFVKG